MNDSQPSNVTHLNRDPKTLFAARGVPHLDSSKFGQAEYTPRPPFQGNQAAQRPFVAKGHDAQLMEAQHNSLPTTLTTMFGNTFVGTIVKRDKFTITLRHSEGESAGQDEIFYKHAIESVLIRRTAD